ncbi:MAG: putative Ig domain-containing protein [bacterium]
MYSLSIPLLILTASLAFSQQTNTQTQVFPSPSQVTAPPTPPAPPEPRINGPSVFGVRPGSPFLYSIPASGERPMKFAVEGLPEALTLDAATGRITGIITKAGTNAVTLIAKNAKGEARHPFKIVVGDRIALTPPMGWSSWNCFGKEISQEKIMAIAKAMEASGLSQHGWTYVNIDDGWQGLRSGSSLAMQGNINFPDMKGMVDTIHSLGLKAGIYSTPWVTSYAGFPGGSADNAQGIWNKGHGMGKFPFAEADARQWADWGFDYLKYDWHVIDRPHVAEMSDALHKSGRDLIFSLSNSAPFAGAKDWAELAESWRTTGDIYDVWDNGDASWHYGVSELGFSQDRWAPFAGPGHWNDPDMLVVGRVGWGGKQKPTRLTPDQQYSHISLWCLLSAPLILGCDLTHLDPFTLGLLTNDEVLAINQDELGAQAVRVGTNGAVDFFLKPLADGSFAFGVFNRGESAATVNLKKYHMMGLPEKSKARDLWRQKDLENFGKETVLTIPGGGVVLLKVTSVKS